MSERQISDKRAMALITDFLNQPGPWNGGDVCDAVASIVKMTGREILDNADEFDE